MKKDLKSFEFEGMTCPKKFVSRAQYDSYLRSLKSNENLEEVAVLKPATNLGFHEQWFRSKCSQATIRIIEPDPPFPGRCEPVDPGDLGQ